MNNPIYNYFDKEREVRDLFIVFLRKKYSDQLDNNIISSEQYTSLLKSMYT